MRLDKKLHLECVLLLAGSCSGANILFFFTGGTYSHDIAIWPLAVHLAERNHSVTYLSVHSKKPSHDPRIRVVTPPKIELINRKYLGDVLKVRLNKKEKEMWRGIVNWSYDICEYLVSNPEKPDTREIFYEEKFDLVILDAVLCDCGYIFAHFHKAKVIVSDSTSVLPWFHHIFGLPEESLWVPASTTFFHYPMSILNIIENIFEPWYWTYLRRTELYPRLDLLIKKLMKDEKAPTFLEIERKSDLIFVNTHPAVELPRSLPPNVIQIGGMHVWGNTTYNIPKKIKNYIEAAEEGAILVAFGTSIDLSNLPEKLEFAFFEAIRRFPRIHFIAKASGKRPLHCPENLMFENWIPQKEALSHPKTLAGITHGGLNGIIEATWLGKPLITIPIFAEQDFQSYKLTAREAGIRLEFRELTADKLAKAIADITTDPKYRSNMKKLQRVFRDRPESPLDLATFWVEFALRHEDLSFMNPITYQSWRVYLEDLVFSFTFWSISGLATLLTLTYSAWFLLRSFYNLSVIRIKMSAFTYFFHIYT